MILYAKKHFVGKQNLRGIEIGVDKADNALSILEELPVDKLFLVDPYVPYEFDGQIWNGHVANAEVAHTKLARYPQAVWLKKTSESASRKFRNQELFDFVYIDGNHSYEFIKKDIMLYYPLIKQGGLIGGHDYIPFYEADQPVIQAVNEFEEETGLALHSVFPDWWFIKNPSNNSLNGGYTLERA